MESVLRIKVQTMDNVQLSFEFRPNVTNFPLSNFNRIKLTN